MRFRTLTLRGLAWAMWFASSCAQAEAGDCHIRIQITDEYGNRVEARQLRLAGSGSPVDVPQDRVIQTTCGHHTLDVGSAGFDSETISFDVFQPDQIVAVVMHPGILEGSRPPCAVMGRIASRTEISRLRLISLFGRHIVDVPADSTNAFQFRNLECGLYLLIAMGNKECLGTQIVKASILPPRLDLTVAAPNGCGTLEAASAQDGASPAH